LKILVLRVLPPENLKEESSTQGCRRGKKKQNEQRRGEGEALMAFRKNEHKA